MSRVLRLGLILALMLSVGGCLEFDSRGSHKPLKPTNLKTLEKRLQKARIVSVSDGDSLTLIASDEQTYKIRLQGIDAPEKKQPYGQACTQQLRHMSATKKPQVTLYKKDRYARLVAKIVIDGKDVALEQLKQGCAWHYKAYAKEQSAADQKAYARAEQQARQSKRGLWQDKRPQAPWDYRAAQRQ